MRDLLSYLRQDPDAVALALLCLLVGGTIVLGIALGRRGDRAATAAERRPAARVLVSTWPHLVRLELCAALATLVLLAWWAIALEPPLAPPADPGFTPTLAKAPSMPATATIAFASASRSAFARSRWMPATPTS